MSQERRTIAIFLLALPLCLLASDHGYAAVFSYECDSLPPNAGWAVINEYCDPEQYIENGWLVQHTQLCENKPGTGQQFDYTRSLEAFEGSKAWFIEWKIFADGDQSEIPFTSPAVLVAANLGGVAYHFVIARDRVRLAHDVPGETVFFDISPDQPHVFRVEQHGVDWFGVFIDGELVHSGIPGGPFPAFFPQVNIRAKSHALENWVYWDYIRWGDVPADASGDLDSDGEVNSFDWPFFAECMNRRASGEAAYPSCAWADFDGDDDVDCGDLLAFQNTWTGGGAPPTTNNCLNGTEIPATSDWGARITALLMLTAAALIVRKTRNREFA